MSVLAHLDAPKPASDRRSAHRRALSLTIDGTVAGDGMPAIVHDLSETGLLLETLAELGVGDEIDVNLPRLGTTRARVVWSSGAYLGCEFQGRITPGAVSAALLRSAPAGTNPVPADPSADATLPSQAEPSLDRYTPRRSFFIIAGLSAAAWAVLVIAFLAS
jgi:hypothetical protein